jgi:hypothetical protein
MNPMKHNPCAAGSGKDSHNPSTKQHKTSKELGASATSQASKRGRPANSSEVRLDPQFRNPVDIERLGKALVAIALKQTVSLESGTDKSDEPGEGHDAR